MRDSLFSPSWYRVAKLKPRLRSHSRIHRHFYRSEKWYVLQDNITGRFYRFSPVAYQIIGMMDGERSVQDLWEKAAGIYGDQAPTQDEMIKLLSQLHLADMLVSNVPPDTAELLKRGTKIEKAKKKAAIKSPLFLKIPIFDPDHFLSKTSFLFNSFFSIFGLLFWLSAVGGAVFLAGLHWPELTENIADRVLSAENLFIIWFVYPLVKSVHELGHGYAVKRWGGEVHEMGIMLLVFMPIPYVDASASSAFREKWQRALVGSSGILVELLLAAIAMFFWVALEPGITRSIMYNIILIGSFSTLIFNGNPLLRYDGYYIFADMVDIPNLAQKGLQYYQYLLKKYVFGVKRSEPPYTGPGEKPWLLGFTATSFTYRLFVYYAIVMFVAGKFFVIGIIFAIWACFTMFVLPIVKGFSFLFYSPLLADNRGRAMVVTVFFLTLLLGGLFIVPVPSFSITEGVVWVADDSLVRAKTSGFIVKLNSKSHDLVVKEDILVECRNVDLEARTRILTAQLKEFQSRYSAALAEDRVAADMIQKEIGNIQARLARIEEENKALTITSPKSGEFILPNEEDITGLFMRKGELLGYVLDTKRPQIKVVVPQIEIDLIRNHTKEVEIRFAERIDRTLCGIIKRETPAAAEDLPSTMLSSAGGGKISIDPFAKNGTKSLEKLFQFEIELTDPVDKIFIGGRSYVRFRHDDEPIGFQWYRILRQTFLKKFNV